MTAAVDVWAAHFGLSATPFTKAVPAAKLFERAAHSEAVARIHYCVNQSALGVITGDTGAGKTVAVRAAVASLDRTKYTLVYLANPSGGCRGLYVAIATALGATPRFHKAEAINQAAALLAAEEHERHRRVLLVIDEAHLLSPEQLEEIRLLSNAELDSAPPLRRDPPRPAHPRRPAPPRDLRRPRPAHRHPLHHRRHGPGRVHRLSPSPPVHRRAIRSAGRR